LLKPIHIVATEMNWTASSVAAM